MKKNLPLFLTLLTQCCFSAAHAQWCVPTTAIPYNANMPGITHVVLNTIDRTSTDLENFPNNSYVNTGLSTDLIPGQTYPISITYTIDGSIAPDMNLRVWIDFNNDGQLDDAGETVISVNNQLPGTYQGSFTIPTTTSPGIKRMRVTAKMTSLGGHTLPSPCDIPPDPLGYHGEIEDYDVDIISTTAILSPSLNENELIVSNMEGKINFSFSSASNSHAELVLMNLEGKVVTEIIPSGEIFAGEHTYSLNRNDQNLQAGIYLVKFTLDKQHLVKRIFIE
jgi:hypothetical protein